MIIGVFIGLSFKSLVVNTLTFKIDHNMLSLSVRCKLCVRARNARNIEGAVTQAIFLQNSFRDWKMSPFPRVQWNGPVTSGKLLHYKFYA